MSESDATAINRACWDVLADFHGQDAYYDTAALLAGEDSLVAEERDAIAGAVGGVAGLDVIHIQCHIGFDSISLARRGARVTGVDFSPASLAKAAALAQRAGVDISWVEADATSLPAQLHGRFDLAYATVGVICWIGDLAGWMHSAAGVLRPGGRLVLIDQHPLARMLGEPDPLSFEFPYAFDGPHAYESDAGYACPDGGIPLTASVEYAHSLGEIITAASDAGLRVERLSEHLEASFEIVPVAARDEDGLYRLRVNGQSLPIMFTLVASRPD